MATSTTVTRDWIDDDDVDVVEGNSVVGSVHRRQGETAVAGVAAAQVTDAATKIETSAAVEYQNSNNSNDSYRGCGNNHYHNHHHHHHHGRSESDRTATATTTTTTTTTRPPAAEAEIILWTIEKALQSIGTGTFQYRVLLASALLASADACEVLVVNYLAIVLSVEWCTTTTTTTTTTMNDNIDNIITTCHDITGSSSSSSSSSSQSQQAWLLSSVFAGMVIGTVIIPPLADRKHICSESIPGGRRPVMIGCSAWIATLGFVTACVPKGRWDLLFLIRFAIGVGLGGMTVPFDTLAEYVEAKYRGKLLLVLHLFYCVGNLITVAFAYVTIGRNWSWIHHDKNKNSELEDDHDLSWRIFVILCALPTCLSLLCIYLFVPESPRYLLEVQHQPLQAMNVLREIAIVNGCQNDDPNGGWFDPERSTLVAEHPQINTNIPCTQNNNEHTDNTQENEGLMLINRDDRSQHLNSSPEQSFQQQMDSHLSTHEDIYPTDIRSNPYRRCAFNAGCWTSTGYYEQIHDLCSSRWWKITTFTWIIFFGIGFAYYGTVDITVQIFSSSSSSSSTPDVDDQAQPSTTTSHSHAMTTDNYQQKYSFDFIPLVLTSVSEIVGLTIVIGWVIDRVGRITIQCTGYVLSAILILMLGVIVSNESPNDDKERPSSSYFTSKVILAVLLRMCLICPVSTAWLSTAELYSTNIRATAGGMANTMGKLGGFVSPFVALEGQNRVPYSLKGLIYFVALMVVAGSAIMLPETKDQSIGEGGNDDDDDIDDDDEEEGRDNMRND